MRLVEDMQVRGHIGKGFIGGGEGLYVVGLYKKGICGEGMEME